MAQGATNPELAAGFEKHTEETKGHVKRLETVCRNLGVASKGDKNQEMAKLIEDGEKLCQDPASTDADLISAAQRVERYEMDGYGQAIAFAKDLGLEEATQELKSTLIEEEAAEEKLARLAKETAGSETKAG
jgi:ferritin-like metal-binding protein YciE